MRCTKLVFANSVATGVMQAPHPTPLQLRSQSAPAMPGVGIPHGAIFLAADPGIYTEGTPRAVARLRSCLTAIAARLIRRRTTCQCIVAHAQCLDTWECLQCRRTPAAGAGISRWRSPATDAASAPTPGQSPFSAGGDDRQPAALAGGGTGHYVSPPDPFSRRYGGGSPAAAAAGGSVPSVASAPSLLQSGGSRHRDHSLHAQHHGLASPTWSGDRTPGIGGGGGGGGPRDAWTPGRKRPRAQADHRPAGPQGTLAGGGSLDADRDGRASTTPRKLGKTLALVNQRQSAWRPADAVL